MLVLSRQAGDGIEFPDLELSLEILKIHSSRVQVGIQAPKSVRILRSELVEPSTGGLLSQLQRFGSDASQTRLRAAMDQLQIQLQIADRHLQSGQTELAELAIQQASEQLRASLEASSAHEPWRAVPPASSAPERISEGPAAYRVAKANNEGLAV